MKIVQIKYLEIDNKKEIEEANEFLASLGEDAIDVKYGSVEFDGGLRNSILVIYRTEAVENEK